MFQNSGLFWKANFQNFNCTKPDTQFNAAQWNLRALRACHRYFNSKVALLSRQHSKQLLHTATGYSAYEKAFLQLL